MKATGIVRRIDDLGRVVIPKEIRRTLRIRMGDPSLKTLTQAFAFCSGMQEIAGERVHRMNTPVRCIAAMCACKVKKFFLSCLHYSLNSKAAALY